MSADDKVPLSRREVLGNPATGAAAAALESAITVPAVAQQPGGPAPPQAPPQAPKQDPVAPYAKPP